jgi:CRP/FNR family transcriptional regulator
MESQVELRIKEKYPFFSSSLVDEMVAYGMLAKVKAGTELMKAGQYVKVLPLVLEGALRVFIKKEEKEFLLYYIEPTESCVMSFSSILSDSPSKVYAVVEKSGEVLLLPVGKVLDWSRSNPEFNKLLFNQYQIRYNDLISSIDQILFSNLEERLLGYLKKRTKLNNGAAIRLTHKEMALDLGSSREVISRLLKKLERDGCICAQNGAWTLKNKE